MKLLQDINIGGTIRKMRIERHMTQMQVAAKLQLLNSTLSESAYCKVEGGTRNLFITDLLRLREIFNVEFNDFFADAKLPELDENEKK